MDVAGRSGRLACRGDAYLGAAVPVAVAQGRANRPIRTALAGITLFGARSLLRATLARQLIYLFRSPNTRVSFVFGIAFGMAFSLGHIIQRGGADHPLAPFGALLAMVTNLGATSNLLGFDADSIWIEVAA